MTPDELPSQPTVVSRPNADPKPALDMQSPEDTDAGWGEQPDADDAERLRRERPPHWE
jgi:hypothetical protein